MGREAWPSQERDRMLSGVKVAQKQLGPTSLRKAGPYPTLAISLQPPRDSSLPGASPGWGMKVGSAAELLSKPAQVSSSKEFLSAAPAEVRHRS